MSWCKPHFGPVRYGRWDASISTPPPIARPWDYGEIDHHKATGSLTAAEGDALRAVPGELPSEIPIIWKLF